MRVRIRHILLSLAVVMFTVVNYNENIRNIRNILNNYDNNNTTTPPTSTSYLIINNVTPPNLVADNINITEKSKSNMSSIITRDNTRETAAAPYRDVLFGFAINYDVGAIYRTVHAFHEVTQRPQQHIALFVNLPESTLMHVSNRFPRVILLNPDKVILPGMGFRNISAASIQNPAHRRYVYQAKWLSDNSNRYDRVIMSDIRDIALYSDPFEQLLVNATDPTIGVQVYTEIYKYKTEVHNQRWIRACYGESYLKKIENESVTCCGVIAGTTKALLDYLHAFLDEYKVKAGCHHVGADTAVHVKIIHDVLTNVQIVNSEHSLIRHNPPSAIEIDSISGGILNADDRLYALVHQYDRHKSLSEQYNKQHDINDETYAFKSSVMKVMKSPPIFLEGKEKQQSPAKAQTEQCATHATGEFTRDSHSGLQPFSEFLGANPNVSDVDDNASICELRILPFLRHFPHAMQQLYSCISYWYAHEQKPSVLAWNKDVRDQLKSKSDTFVTGVIISLSGSNNLTFLDTDVTPLPNSSVFAIRKPGYVVNSPKHLRKFRDDTVGLIHSHGVTSCLSSSLRIGILNRRKNRRLVNEKSVIMDIKQALPNSTTIHATEFENASFEDQVRFFSTVDILVSPHGAQLTGLAFMPNCGQILELTPKGYHIPYFFGSLANASGLGYGYVYTSPGDPVNETKAMSATIDLRNKARSANLCPSTTSIVQGVLDLFENWNNCCKIDKN